MDFQEFIAFFLFSGHELTHGFDDEGVQWDPVGALSKPANENCTGWMDEQSSAKFKLMAQCVIGGDSDL